MFFRNVCMHFVLPSFILVKKESTEYFIHFESQIAMRNTKYTQRKIKNDQNICLLIICVVGLLLTHTHHLNLFISLFC